MKPLSFLKLAAVASSVLLLVGFVCYRAGVFSRLLHSDPPYADSLMGSSKSKVFIVPPSPDTLSDPNVAPSEEAPQKDTESKRTLMIGSKSFGGGLIEAPANAAARSAIVPPSHTTEPLKRSP
jgi:hypothetical protein